MSVTPTSTGTVTFTAIVPGTKTLASQINNPLTTVFARANSLTADVQAIAAALNDSLTGNLNNNTNLTDLAELMGGVASGSWPNVTFAFTAEALTGFKVNRDVFYYYQVPIALTSTQPLMYFSQPRKLRKAGVKYFRDNTTAPGSNCVISVRKVSGTTTTEIGQIIITSAHADKTWIDQSANFPLDIDFAAGDYLTLVPTTIPSGAAAQDISIILPFEEKVRVA